MKVASFNVNSLRARLPIVLEWLAKASPDVLCVQETKVQDADFPAGAFDEIGYRCAFKGQKSYNGVAILSRHPIEKVEYGLPDEPHDEPRLIRAEVMGLPIVNTYVPQGYLPESEKFQYKLQWFARLRKYFQQNFSPQDALLWVGDLNIAPAAIDVYDPQTLLGHVCFHPQVQPGDGLGLCRCLSQALRPGGPIHLLGLQNARHLHAQFRLAPRPRHGDRPVGRAKHRLHHRQRTPRRRTPQRPCPRRRRIQLAVTPGILTIYDCRFAIL